MRLNTATSMARAQRDDALLSQIQRERHAKFQVYGTDKVWR
jgi:hypothetical protein